MVDDKSVWGPHYWYVLETVADQYPDKATPQSKTMFTNTITAVAHAVPCGDCKEHGMDYISNNVPEPENRESAIRYICNFRNSANERAGHPVVNCDQIVKRKLADSTPNADTTTTAAAPVELTAGQRAILRSKEAGRDVINSYADQDGIERPDIVNQPCPGIPETSCVDPKTRTIYMNPYTDSDRQRLHEYQHYRDLVTNNVRSSEDQANDFAYDQLNKVAPTLVPLGYQAPQPTPDVSMIGDMPTPSAQFAWSTLEKADLKRMGLDHAESKITDGHKEINKEIADIDRLAGRRKGKNYVSIEEEFPMYAMMVREDERKKREEERKKEQSRGALSILDPIYESYGRAMGFVDVPAHQLNLAYTPQIIENLVMTLAEANMTSAGAGLLSAGLGITFFLGGLLGRKKLVTNDQLLLQNLAGSFFWRTMEFLNPKRKMKESVEDLMDELKEGHYSPKILFETPEHALRASKANQATAGNQQQQQPGVPGSVEIDSNGNPVAAGTAIGVTDTATDAGYELDGDDYYDDTDRFEIDRGQGYIQPTARNIYTAVPDANAADPGDLVVDTSSNYASEDDDEDYDIYG